MLHLPSISFKFYQFVPLLLENSQANTAWKTLASAVADLTY